MRRLAEFHTLTCAEVCRAVPPHTAGVTAPSAGQTAHQHRRPSTAGRWEMNPKVKNNVMSVWDVQRYYLLLSVLWFNTQTHFKIRKQLQRKFPNCYASSLCVCFLSFLFLRCAKGGKTSSESTVTCFFTRICFLFHTWASLVCADSIHFYFFWPPDCSNKSFFVPAQIYDCFLSKTLKYMWSQLEHLTAHCYVIVVFYHRNHQPVLLGYTWSCLEARDLELVPPQEVRGWLLKWFQTSRQH